jgi:hypothetical protein
MTTRGLWPHAQRPDAPHPGSFVGNGSEENNELKLISVSVSDGRIEIYLCPARALCSSSAVTNFGV